MGGKPGALNTLQQKLKWWKEEETRKVSTHYNIETQSQVGLVPVAGSADRVELAEYRKANRADVANIYQLPMAETSCPDISGSVEKQAT